MTLSRRLIGCATAAMLAGTAIPAEADSPPRLSDAVRRHAAREAPALQQIPMLFTPRRQTRAPALLPILIGAGLGCGLSAGAGIGSRAGVKWPIWACIGGAVWGGAIGSVISSR